MQFKDAVEEAHVAAEDLGRDGIQEASANQDAGRQLPDPALGQASEETKDNQQNGRQVPDPAAVAARTDVVENPNAAESRARWAQQSGFEGLVWGSCGRCQAGRARLAHKWCCACNLLPVCSWLPDMPDRAPGALTLLCGRAAAAKQRLIEKVRDRRAELDKLIAERRKRMQQQKVRLGQPRRADLVDAALSVQPRALCLAQLAWAVSCPAHLRVRRQAAPASETAHAPRGAGRLR